MGSENSNLVTVLGSGNMGMRHLDYFRAVTQIEPIMVSRRPARLDELRRLGLRTATSLERAYREGSRRCVVATDTGAHVQDIGEALSHGFDVLTEKPMAVSYEEAKTLPGAFADNGRHLFVACVMRFTPSLQYFQSAIPLVGRLHHVRIEHQSYLPDWRPDRPYMNTYSARLYQGGVLLDLIHEVDLAIWIFGCPDRVFGSLMNLNRLGIEAEETSDIQWESCEGARVSMSLDYLTRPPRRTVVASGECGTVTWDGIGNAVTTAIAGSVAQRKSFDQPMVETFRNQARAFLAVCEGVTDPRLARGEDGLRALAVCDATRASTLSHQEEQVIGL